ncbi:MAG: helix-turn-helix domain-containing protein [Alphaproteobacteria bacterium]|nr:helix-turn-helix domain-containing protein [Alphaproteobacteria bacterium]
MTGQNLGKQAPKRTLYITATEAADYLRLKPATLAAMRVDGSGPTYYKVGNKRRGKVLYTYEDLDAWLARYRFGSTSEYGA